MITDFLVILIYGIVLAVVSLFTVLPDVSLSSDLIDSITGISPYYSSLGTVMPIGVLLSILIFELGFIGIYFGYKLIRWGYQKIPFLN